LDFQTWYVEKENPSHFCAENFLKKILGEGIYGKVYSL
jgi:hypothetical protein